jgi:hypothetical protein
LCERRRRRRTQKTKEISSCAKSDARNLLHKPTKTPISYGNINLVLFYLIICEGRKTQKNIYIYYYYY